ncbi:hypothetical protein AVEN_140208-1 [Araneus ventricosus]|uniref:Uncharacterized protein n=1 Tax=Araneus ventricosus TaxID=182803 RepID=A0A4Y2I763_ARAVE|nr:hypothetical protein AVEN_140208-1 [Araneus ventricosus]
MDIYFVHLQSHDLRQRHNLFDYILLRYYLNLFKVTFNNTLKQKLLTSTSEGSLGNPFPCILYHLQMGTDVEVIFPKLFEVKEEDAYSCNETAPRTYRLASTEIVNTFSSL